MHGYSCEYMFGMHACICEYILYTYVLTSCPCTAWLLLWKQLVTLQVQHVRTGCCTAALWSWRYLTPLAAEVIAYYEPSTCWLCVLNWCTCIQMHCFVKYWLKFLSLPNIIGAKRPLAIACPRQQYGHSPLWEVQFDCTTAHWAACSKSLEMHVWSCDNGARTMVEEVVDCISLPGGIFERYASASARDR